MAKRKPNVKGQGVARKLQFIGNTPSPETFDILYERYVKAYNAAKGKLRAGQNMYLTRKNKQEFIEFYMAVANETPQSDTPQSTANQIINNMVEESRYEYNNKQAHWKKKGLEKMGIEAEIIDIREGKMGKEIRYLDEEIEERTAELKKQGYNSSMVAHIIGVEFFGSPT